VGGQLAGLRRWLGANIAPLVLIALAGILLWVAIWRVWLPAPDGGSPSRRSETLALTLVLLAVGAAVLGVFHDRLSSFALDRTGFKVVLDTAQRQGVQTLVEELGRRGAAADAYPAAVGRYVAELARNGSGGRAAAADASGAYERLARRIADDLADH
jgi:hypothetical protein